MSTTRLLLSTSELLYSILLELLPCQWSDLHLTGKFLLSIIDAFKDLFFFILEEVKSILGDQSILSTLGYLLLWTIGWMIAIHFQHGLLYFIISLLTFMMTNLGERKEGELSAYSVFNRNFERLPGTLDAEQFDAELRHNLPMNNHDMDDEQENGDNESEEEGGIDRKLYREAKRSLQFDRQEAKQRRLKENEAAAELYLKRLQQRYHVARSRG